MTELTLGEEKQITTWRAALTQVSELAHARLPESLHGHLERATALCVHRHVWFDEDGKHAQVLSSDGESWYLVNGNCTCMDAPKAPNGYCKHKLATMIYRRASELLAASRGTPAAPTPAALPEAPASANVRVLIEGREVQVTLRDTDEERLLTRLAALLARYPQAAQTSSIVAPDGGTPAQAPTCPYHGSMKESTKVKGTFFCPAKMGDGKSYCQEKWPKK